MFSRILKTMCMRSRTKCHQYSHFCNYHFIVIKMPNSFRYRMKYNFYFILYRNVVCCLCICVQRQILLHTGRCVAVSEPTSPYIVVSKYRKFGDSQEIRQLTRDVIRWECRPYQTMQPSPLGYCLKLATVSILGFKMFRFRQ